jgi:hypothetical protein
VPVLVAAPDQSSQSAMNAYQQIANLGPQEQRKRLVMGFVSLAVGALLIFFLFAYGAPRWSRALILLPLWMAGLGLFQARAKT